MLEINTGDIWTADYDKTPYPHVLIRRRVRGGTNLLVDVALKGRDYGTRGAVGDPWNVRISMNGPVALTFEEWGEFMVAVAEARDFLLGRPGREASDAPTT
jgi:hypothetical protein